MRVSALLLAASGALSACAQAPTITTTSGAPLSSGIHAGDPGDVFGPSNTFTLSGSVSTPGPSVSGSGDSASVTQTPGAKPPSSGTNSSVPQVPDGNTPPANTTDPDTDDEATPSPSEPPNGAVGLLARPAVFTVVVAGIAVFVLWHVHWLADFRCSRSDGTDNPNGLSCCYRQ